MDIILTVVINKAESIKINGKDYVVNEAFASLCKKVFRLYAVLIGVICVIGVNLAMFLNINEWFGIILFTVIILVIYNFIADLVVRRFIIKRVIS